MGMGKPLAKTNALWRERLERLAKSEKSEEEFAAIEGVKPSSLKWWRWRLNAMDANSGAIAPIAPGVELKFVEVTEAKRRAAGGACQFEVVLRNGRLVRVAPGFEDGELARLLEVVEGSRR